MAQPLSAHEDLGWTVGPDRRSTRGEAALARLRDIARRSVDDAAVVAALLDAAADVVERSQARGALPEAERDAWATVGARFDQRAARRSDERLVEAFGALLDRCVVSDAAMADRLGVDRSRISQRVADGSLYAFTAGGERCFPRWQVVDGAPVSGLRDVVAALDPSLHPLSVDHWFTTPNVDLAVDGDPVSPAAWLATGGDPGTAAALAADR